MPDTLTIIPRQVTIDGEVLYEALLDLDTVRHLLETANRRQDTDVTSALRSISGTLFEETLGPIWVDLEASDPVKTPLAEKLDRESWEQVRETINSAIPKGGDDG